MITQSHSSGWQAGVARRDITPQHPVWLAGYGNRTGPCKDVRQAVSAKAVALRDAAGTTAVLVTADLLGFSGGMVAPLRHAALERYGLAADRLLLAASHSHSSPVAGDLLAPIYIMLPEDRVATARYTDWVIEQILDAVGAAIEALAPAELAFGQGLAGFGVNRRRARPGRRHFPGPVDQDVPVLAVRDSEGAMLGVVFGYACHTTTTASEYLNGDYAGYAQTGIEAANPGAVAMFVAGCGADINPLPRTRDDLPEVYGDILALAVQQALEAPMKPLSPQLATGIATVSLPLQATPSRDELEGRLAGAPDWETPRIQYFIDEFDRTGRVKSACAYDIAAWKLGDSLTLVAMGGEVVVDYALRFKARLGWDDTWVAGYCHELVTYIPSERVWREGDYEGRDAMFAFGYSAPFESGVEERIAQELERVLAALGE